MKKWQGLAFGFLIILIISLFVFTYSGKLSVFKESEEKKPELSVSSQSLIEDKVIIDYLYLDKPGYVVIHSDNDGQPGEVIGHSDLISGEANYIQILIDETKAGTKIFVMLHYDDNGDGIYGFPDEDKPALLEEGIIVKPIIFEKLEEDIIVESPVLPAVKEFSILADEYGFYIDGKDISSISVNSGEKVKIIFNVDANKVYYGGLDFKGCGQNTGKINPGNSIMIEFTPAEKCTITSYWPSSGVVKDKIEIVVS